MKTYAYDEPLYAEDGITLISRDPLTKTEDEIIEEYYPRWSAMMEKAGRRPSREDCIDDWIVIHWAWEV